MKQEQRKKEAVEPGAPAGASTKGRTAKELADEAVTLDENGFSALVNSLTPEEVISLVDVGTEIEEQRRSIDKDVKFYVEPIKALLLNLAKQLKKKEIKGSEKRIAKIGRASKTTMGTATSFVKDVLKKEGKLNLFDQLVNVKLTEAKKYLGEDALKGFIKVTSEEYGSVALKKLP